MEFSPQLKEKYAAHIGTDVNYPTSCEQIVNACNNMSEFNAEEKQWFAKALPHGVFNTAADVKKAVGL